MSRRVLRKLQSKTTLSDELEKFINDGGGRDSADVDNSTSSDDNVHGSRESNANPFDVLNNDRTPSDNEAKEDDDLDLDQLQDLDDGDPKSASNYANSSTVQVAGTDSLKRKKKKRKKKPKESQEARKADNDDDDEEDVEVVAQEVKAMLGETSTSGRSPPKHSSSSHSSLCSSQNSGILSIDYRHLVADNELRKIFGSRVIQSQAVKRRSNHSRAHARTCKLVTVKQTWPPLGKLGLSMKLVESKNGLHYFKFEHNAHYQQIQFQFFDAVESLDPSNIAVLLDMHVYHIDALLQLSDIVRLGEEMQIAVDLIERALYCFEMSFHALFNVAVGNCRVDYRYDENRPFYVALFKHLTFIGQRGCHRTALEFCKVLLGLSPEEDPLGVLLMIDFYALKSGEYAYLLNFYDTLESCRNLSQLPNFAFSAALARFHLASTSSQEADLSLQSALLAFPGLLLPLLDKCGVQGDARVLNHAFFGPSNCLASHPPALCTLMQLYVGRCWHLWKEPEVLSWLEVQVKLVLDRVDKGDELAFHHAEKRKVRYQGMPRNIYRHILLSEIKDATANLPPDMAASSVLSFDPLPPTDSISSYSKPERTQTDTGHNFFHVLLHSLFPQYSVQEAAGAQQQRNRNQAANNAIAAGRPVADRQAGGVDADLDAALALAADGGEGGGGGGAVGGVEEDMQAFRNSVTQVLDAMRDLLSNFQVADVELDGGQVADDSESDDVPELE